MKSDDKYGEVKTRKNIFPKQAKELVKKAKVGILLIQAKASDKTKEILTEGNITLYEGIEPKEIEKIREIVSKELREKESKEKEKC